MEVEKLKEALCLLFDRPKEPVFHGKGDDGVIFDIPTSFIAKRFQSVSNAIASRMKRSNNPKMEIHVNENLQLPDIRQFIDELPRDKSFSLWIPRHSKIAEKMIRLFIAQSSIENLLAVASFVRDEVNTELFNYSLSVALLHREDTRSIKIPSLVETFPYKFLHPLVVRQARESLSILPKEFRAPIAAAVDSPNYNNKSGDVEQKLWYFREDIGVNLHHWHWHLVYPHTGIRELVVKDRRGELFYYMHQQIMARYNSERICNEMSKLTSFSDFGGEIRDGYFPQLNTLVANRSWPSRPDRTTPMSVVREEEELRIDIDEMKTFVNRYREVVTNGVVVSDEGEEHQLDEYYGIDILGNLIESTTISPNQELYGNLHNFMHLIISYSHDPKNVHLEELGVIGDPTTAMRDPIFYRIHAFIDELFQEFKAKLPPYPISYLRFPDVNIVTVETETIQNNSMVKNKLFTFWQHSDVNLSRGLDFSPRGDVFARITHLQHGAFTIKVIVNNTGRQKGGTVRIFMSSKYGHNGEALNFNQQRLLMMEIDRFTTQRKKLKLSLFCFEFRTINKRN